MSTPTSGKPVDPPTTTTGPVFIDLIHDLLHTTTLDATKRSIELAETWGVALTLEIKAIKTVAATLKEQGMRIPAPKEEALNKSLSEALKIVEAMLEEMGVKTPGPTEEAQPQPQGAK